MKKKPFTILIADDDQDDQQLMREGLRDCKVDVRIVPVFDGVQVMDYLLRKHAFRQIRSLPDLLLLDLNMPLMDGFNVLKTIRTYPEFSSLPVYIITTSRNKSEFDLAMRLGATGYYHKGASSRDIVRIMKEVCEECFDTAST